MMRGLGWIVLSLVLVLSAKEAVAAGLARETPYGYLQQWIGHQPTQDSETGLSLPLSQTFWADPLVHKSMKEALAPTTLKTLETCWGGACLEAPIQKYQQHLVISVCSRADCLREQMLVFFDLFTGVSAACIKTQKAVRGDHVTENRWEAPRDKRRLGAEACDEDEAKAELARIQRNKIRDELSFGYNK